MNCLNELNRKISSLVSSVLCCFLMFSLMIVGCKKTEVTATPPVPAPSITHFSPAHAGIGYPVVISGSGFKTDISAITASINGVTATVHSASDSQIVINVPVGAKTGKLMVSVGGQSGTSATDIQIKSLTVTTIAGSGTPGYADGTGSAASFSGLWGIVGDGNGNFYVGDGSNSRIRKVTAAGVVTTVSGSDSQGNIDGPVASASFGLPYGVAMDSHGNLFITNLGLNNIRKISADGIVSTFAGDPNGISGSANGTGTAARFNAPLGIVIDPNDNIFVTDATNYLIRKITPAGVVTTLAGSGQVGSADGNGSAASFNLAFGIGIDANSDLYVVDAGNNNIRKVTQAGVVTTFAGSGTKGSADGPANTASFNGPIGIVADHSGNFYVTDESNGLIRMISPDGFVSTVAGNGILTTVDGVGNTAGFSFPLGITIDASGTLYVLDNGSGTVRKIVVQ